MKMNRTFAKCVSRRNFLRIAAIAPLAAATKAHALTPIQRTGGPMLKPTLNAYSFLELLNANLNDSSKGIDLFGVCDFCANHDIEAVDLTGYFFPGYPQAPADAYLNRMKRYTHERGIVISGTGVRNDFAAAGKTVRASGRRTDEAVDRGRREAWRAGHPRLRRAAVAD